MTACQKPAAVPGLIIPALPGWRRLRLTYSRRAPALPPEIDNTPVRAWRIVGQVAFPITAGDPPLVDPDRDVVTAVVSPRGIVVEGSALFADAVDWRASLERRRSGAAAVPPPPGAPRHH